jgi:hypothetical protein
MGIVNEKWDSVACQATVQRTDSAKSTSVTLVANAPATRCPDRAPAVFVFNPFAEGWMARGKAFTPVTHQVLLAEDLANLPQFLGQQDDIVLLVKRPASSFLQTLKQAGFPLPEFVELRKDRIDPGSHLCRRDFRCLRPWAWGPDSLELLEPLFVRVVGEPRLANQYFNDDIAGLYSKAWSVVFLSNVLARCRTRVAAAAPRIEAHDRAGAAAAGRWLCSEEEVGRVVDTLDGALGAIAAIRSRGHHRVVVKAAHGLAGQHAIRLWEPELLPAQRRWLVHALSDSGKLVVEPWLERALDFSVQLEMEPHGLALRGYTGLINDRKGQFRANWAEREHRRQLPASVNALLGVPPDAAWGLDRLYVEIFTLLEAELQRVGFLGPISIDALVYRTAQGACRLKPIVEVNPRYTMGRLTVELMKHVCPESGGLFRLVTRVQAREEGFADLSSYAHSLRARLPLLLEREPAPRIRQGALCLNDPEQARVCLATFEVHPTLPPPGSLGGHAPPPND